MPYYSYETDTKKIPFIANRFPVRYEVFTVAKIHIVVFKVMTQLLRPGDGCSFSKALVSTHHTIQIRDKLMSCGWMWLTACPTHLPFHIIVPVSCVECGRENVKKCKVLGQDVTADGTECDVLWV